MTWPNDNGSWKALADGERIDVAGKPWVLSVVDCGELTLPTGQLVACDPFTSLGESDGPRVEVPPGRYPVRVTLADVSGLADGSHVREADATVVLSTAPEVTRRAALPPEQTESLPAGDFIGFGVDTGTACLVDAGSIDAGMPDADSWYDEVFESGKPDSWFARMDDPDHIRAGIANIPLPLGADGANIVVIHSGWGDGVYPLVEGFDAAGNLVRVHIDFMVVGHPNPCEED